MTTMTASTARDRLSEVLDIAQTEAVIIERHGRKAAVVISYERYDELMNALEDAEDLAAVDAVRVEGGPNLPWEQVKAELGW